MSGKTDFVFWAVSGLALAGAGWDLAQRRIPNFLNWGGMLAGVAFHAFAATGGGAGSALLGVSVGFLALGWMFFLGWMGAGDVKFLMALGAWMGPGPTLQVALASVLVGGGIALVQLSLRREGRRRLIKIWRLFQSIFIKELKLEVPEVDQRLRMPFGVAIAIAVILVEKGFEVWTWLGVRNV